MEKSNNPLLKEKEVLIEVTNRTGLPYDVVYKTMKSYQEILQECIDNGVEVKFGDMGRFCWRKKPPRYGVVYYNIQTGENNPPIDTPGFYFPKFIPTKKWRMELKEKTKFYENKKENEKEEE